jgi:hypothetical protein
MRQAHPDGTAGHAPRVGLREMARAGESPPLARTHLPLNCHQKTVVG